MQKKYLYTSIAFHIVIVLLCVIDIPYFSSKHNFDDQPPIIVDLNDVIISDTTNLPEKAEFGEENKQATRKERPVNEKSAPAAAPAPKQESPVKEETPPEPVIETPEIKSPSLVEDAPKMEESIEEPSKEEKKPTPKKKKPAPIPQKKPQIKPDKKPEAPKKPQPNTDAKTENKNDKKKPNNNKPNPLSGLDNLFDDLQKQVDKEDALAQIKKGTQVNNLGVEGGTSKGSYFSELSVSGVDFVKSKIQENWKTIAGGKDDRNIEVIVNVKVSKEGKIISVDIEDMRRYRSDNYFAALADSAERAIKIADEVHNVFSVLAKQNASRYNEWKEIRFTFTPLGLSR